MYVCMYVCMYVDIFTYVYTCRRRVKDLIDFWVGVFREPIARNPECGR